MKETVLTSAELGENYRIVYICIPWDVNYHRYNCTTVGEEIPFDTMEYTWTETCHNANHGYSNSSSSCDNTNSYATSKIKEMLETMYLPTIGETNLKEVDGYKIRLITVDELESNLGYTQRTGTNIYYYDSENTPTWVYQNFGDQNKNVYSYWTMTSYSNNSSFVWYVSGSNILGYGPVSNTYGIRPVINLLKSAIE